MYTLIDGVKRNAEHPATFDVPSELEKSRVAAGDHVKLGFELANPYRCERMWVLVTGPGVGTLANDPVYLDEKFGDKVHFEPKNILDILWN